jgi:hypothetical protein
MKINWGDYSFQNETEKRIFSQTFSELFGLEKIAVEY